MKFLMHEKKIPSRIDLLIANGQQANAGYQFIGNFELDDGSASFN